MMRLVCALVLAPLTLALDDSSQLFQANVHLKGDETKPISIPHIEFKSPEQIKLEKDLRILKMIKATTPTPEERYKEFSKAMEANPDDFGVPITLVVRDPAGHEILVAFRTKARLENLMETIARRYGLKIPSSQFTYKGKEIDPEGSPNNYNMADRDIIEVDGLQLQEWILAKREEAKNAYIGHRVKTLRAKLEKKGVTNQKDLLRRLKDFQRSSAIRWDKKKNPDLMRRDLIKLQFKHVHKGQADFRFVVRKNIKLQSTLDLVAKQFGVPRAQTRFHRIGLAGTNLLKTEIRPTDTAVGLNLKEEEVIKVEVLRAR